MNVDKIDRTVLALLQLTLHEDNRAWKSFDWSVMNRLHERGFIADPVNKAKSVTLTTQGLAESKRLFEELFGNDWRWSRRPRVPRRDAAEHGASTSTLPSGRNCSESSRRSDLRHHQETGMEQRKSAEAAQAVIDQARSEANERRNARAGRVSPLYRFDELKALQPWQQYALVEQASALANREPSVIALCGIWLTVIVALAFAAPDWFHGSAVWTTISFLVLTFLLYQRARVRHHVRQLLRASSLDPQACAR